MNQVGRGCRRAHSPRWGEAAPDPTLPRAEAARIPVSSSEKVSAARAPRSIPDAAVQRDGSRPGSFACPSRQLRATRLRRCRKSGIGSSLSPPGFFMSSLRSCFTAGPAPAPASAARSSRRTARPRRRSASPASSRGRARFSQSRTSIQGLRPRNCESPAAPGTPALIQYSAWRCFLSVKFHRNVPQNPAGEQRGCALLRRCRPHHRLRRLAHPRRPPLRPRHLLRLRHRRRLLPRTHAGARGPKEPEDDLGESQPDAIKDFGNCEKIGLVQDWCVRMSKEEPDYTLRIDLG